MASSVNATTKYIRPVLSLNKNQTRKKVLALYKTWYREIPQIVQYLTLPVSEKTCLNKLREEFRKHANVTDVRVIDFLILKARQDQQETLNRWTNKGQILDTFNLVEKKKQSDFLGKFLSGHD